MHHISAAWMRKRFGRIGLCLVIVSGAFAKAQETASQPDAETRAAEAKKRELSERILQNTTGARDKLTDKQLGKETQRLQQDVVKDLESLLELLKQTPPPPPPNQGNPPPDAQNPIPRPPSDAQTKPSRKPKSPGTGAGQNREQPQDSEERHGESREGKQKADRKLRLENDIWGHLPPALREELLNTYGERMLPQYEEFVRKFYEGLSEPHRTKKR